MAGVQPTGDRSPLDATLARVGDRWSLLLVEALLDGPLRFGELQAAVPGIAPNILAERLRRLERERVLRAAPYSDRPPRLSYALTSEGLALGDALRMLAAWGAAASDGEVPRHEACGTPMEAHWYCPTCARPVSAEEATRLASL